jgi:hypothetical protein
MLLPISGKWAAKAEAKKEKLAAKGPQTSMNVETLLRRSQTTARHGLQTRMSDFGSSSSPMPRSPTSRQTWGEAFLR